MGLFCPQQAKIHRFGHSVTGIRRNWTGQIPGPGLFCRTIYFRLLFPMKKILLLLLVGVLMLVSRAPAAAQSFHRIGHANRSHTIKSERSNKHVKHRDKQKTKKGKPDNGEGRRHKQAKGQEKLKDEAGNRREASEPEKVEP